MTVFDKLNDNPTIFLMRHGDSRIDQVRRFIGQHDSSLNALGRLQAQWWSRKLAHISFSRVHCSDLIRTRQTAAIVSENNPTPTCHSQLREISLGQWEGLPFAEIQKLYPEQFKLRGRDIASYRPKDGESFEDLSERVLPTFHRIAKATNSNTLIVGHAGVNRTILCYLLGMELNNLFNIHQDYGCLNILQKIQNRWKVSAINLTPETPPQV